MNETEKQLMLDKFKSWFKDSLIQSHKKNTQKLVDIKEFNINPFLLYYLSNYLEGDSQPRSLAKALVYPRVLGTSITTSFGYHMQSFITKVLGGYGSAVQGIDIEYYDAKDGRKKYCQLKSGPNGINSGDVETINNHFQTIKNLARVNMLELNYSDLIFALTYGERSEINSFIHKLNERDVVVLVGKEFWYHFTGDESFYYSLIRAAGEVANDVNMKQVVSDVIDALSVKIENRFDDLFN